MSLEIARKIVDNLRQRKDNEIESILNNYDLEQRRCIMGVKYKRSSLLFIAVAKKSLSIVSYFLESCGADPNSYGWIDDEKLSSLALAIEVNSETIVNLLLIHGASTETISSYERTPLFHACTESRHNIVRMLVERGADVNGRNYAGETPLTELIDNINLFKYLISNGTDVNSMDDFGQTPLMLGFETERDDIVHLLLDCDKVDVRIKNDSGDDALHLAVRYSSDDIIQKIIDKGGYSKEEIVEVYRIESLFSHIGREAKRAEQLWQHVIKLQSWESNTPMFDKKGSTTTGQLKEIIKLFNADDAPALIYLDSKHGLSNLFTLGAFTRAVSNVIDEDRFMLLCEFFFDTMKMLDNELFFKSFSQSVVLIRHHFDTMHSNNTSNLSKSFYLFVEFIENIHERFINMAPRERTPFANKIECLLYFTIDLICKIDEKYQEDINLFLRGIRRILKTDLRGQQLKSIIQMCGALQSSDRIINCFIRCGADVNSTDREGKTVLHEVMESDMPFRETVVRRIIDNGFNFSDVRCEEYCLVCKIEMEDIPHYQKHISLQCLAARTLCEETVIDLSQIPRNLRQIINSHSFLL